MKTKVVTLDAKGAGEIELSDAVFGLEPRADLLHRVVVWQLAKRRAGTHKTKTRGEIRASTRKIYRQKRHRFRPPRFARCATVQRRRQSDGSGCS